MWEGWVTSSVWFWFPDNPPTQMSKVMAMSDSSEEISKLILLYLNKMKHDFPDKPNVYRKIMQQDLQIDDQTLDSHIQALSEKYLVYVQTPIPYSPWTHVNITATGAIQAEENIGKV